MTLLSLSMRQLGLMLSISWMLGVAPINMVPKCRVNKTMAQVWEMSRAREWRALASQDVLGRSVLQAFCISTHLSIVCAPLGLFITIRDPLQATCQTVGLRTLPAETRIARSHSRLLYCAPYRASFWYLVCFGMRHYGSFGSNAEYVRDRLPKRCVAQVD
jgi:hypothetical protein